MTQISVFNRTNLQILRVDLATAVQSVEKKYGIKIEFGNARFTADSVSLKTNATIPLAVSQQTAQNIAGIDANNFFKYKFAHNLPFAALGAIIDINGHKYRIDGYSPRKKKYPIMAAEIKFGMATGRKFKFSTQSIARAVQAAGIE